MKTKFYFLVISFLAICSVCLPACDNDEKGDVTKPVIDLIEPEEGAVLKIGNGKGVHFEMNLSDDVMLRSYKSIFIIILTTTDMIPGQPERKTQLLLLTRYMMFPV